MNRIKIILTTDTFLTPYYCTCFCNETMEEFPERFYGKPVKQVKHRKVKKVEHN
jgi:hypothetical protein